MEVHRLHLTDVTLPAHHPRAGSPCPVFAYLVDHRGGAILYDTGVGTDGREIDALFGAVHHSLDAALAAAGAAVGDVVLIVNSHLHFDHCGNNRRFPGVPLIAQRAEYDAARRPRYTVPGWVDFPGARWELVDGETEVAGGVSVLPTPGHTPGHQSLVLRDGASVVVLAGQAVYDGGELEAEASVEPLPPEEAAATTASAARIMALRPDRVLFAHDAGSWPTPEPAR